MDDIKNPKTLDDCSNRISKDSQQSVDNSLNQSRSYLCSFCIRGFSNAQALGGHMNIHRRDRAKLRQKLIEDDHVVGESDSSLDLNEQQDHEEVLTCDDDHQDMEKDISPAGPKLGFWVEENKQSNDHGKIKEVNIDGSSSSHHNHEIEGLDLELRLGQSAEKKTTKSPENCVVCINCKNLEH